MLRKEILVIIIKVIIYACTLVLGIRGVAAMTSCSVSRETTVTGTATIVTTDTTIVHHNSILNYPKH